jgi:peptidoglycan-N-acetylglucosamine deacetylase
VARSLSCCLTFDFDAMSAWLGMYGTDSPASLSRGEFGAYALPRILRVLSEREIRATFFTPGHTALAYPHLVERILEDGHELAHHGWVHEDASRAGPDGERRNLERGLEALELVGAARAVGYRLPGGTATAATTALLLEHGFAYDSSRNATDFHPYYLRVGDVPSFTEPFAFGEPCELVEAPFSYCLTDFAPFEFVRGVNPGFAAPSTVEEIWRGEFDFAYKFERDGFFGLVLHPEVIGRGHRLTMLLRLLDHMRERDVVFEPLVDYVARWRVDNPLDEWRRANPTLTGSGAHTALPGDAAR